MKKITLYRYLGTNGIIESPVHLEDIYYVRLTQLIADEGKQLTDGNKYVLITTVPEEEVSNWTEVKIGQN